MFDELINDSSLHSFVNKMISSEDILKKKLNFKIENVSENEEEIFREMTFWRTKLQSGINLNINYEYYKDCSFVFDESGHVNKNKDKNKNSFNSFSLTEAAVRYAYYHAVLVSKSIKTSQLKKKMDVPRKQRKQICFYCDNEIKENEDKCEVCDSEEFEYKTIKKDSDIPKMLSNVLKIDDNNRKITNDVRDKTVTSTEQKWSCSECSFINVYESQFCEICFSEFPNNNQQNIISKEIKVSLNDDEGKNEKNEGKKCWFKRCTRNFEIINNFCSNCGLDQSGINDYGYKLKRRKRSGKICNVWICSHCTSINNGMENICAVCGNELCSKDNKMCPHCRWMNKNFRIKCCKCTFEFPK